MTGGPQGVGAPGTPDPARCSGCGTPVSEQWAHCGQCGHTLSAATPPEREHQVTVVVSDLQGSTALAEALDPESLRLVLDRYFDELGAVLQANGGRVEKRIGDMMVTVFGLPEAGPDDATHALRGAAECQGTLARLNEGLDATWGVRLVNRTGVATGAVVYATAGGAHRLLVGGALEAAAALEPLAPPLEVLAAPSTVAAAGAAASFGPAQRLAGRAGEELWGHQLLTVAAGAPRPPGAPGAVDDGRCAACGEVSAQHRWCTRCGLPTGQRLRPEDRRRTLTIVFVDLRVEAVVDGQTIASPVERSTLIAAFATARTALEAHGGIVEHYIGDAVMAVYGLDRRHDDDATRAARAALEVQERLAATAGDLAAEHAARLVVRIGVNTGPVVAGDPEAGERLVTGDAVNVAARLEQTAWPGAVVIGEQTRQLIGPAAAVVQLAPLALKGKAEPVGAYRLFAIDHEVQADRRFELPLVGRDAEVAALHRAWAATVSSRSWHRLAIHGEAGVGKSRLVHEVLDHLDPGVRVLRGVCLPYGEGITFWPVAEVVRQAAGLSAHVEAIEARRLVHAIAPEPEVGWRLCALLGLDDRIVAVAELSWAVRRLLDHLAASRPTVVVVDGLHWAEPTLVDLLDDLIAHGGPVPGLLVTMSRASAPGPTWPGAGGARTAVVEVDALDEGAIGALVSHALGEGTLGPELRAHLATVSAGVPLFLEQWLTMLVDDGRLVRGPDGWRITVSLDELSVPPSIEAVLAARIDALPDAVRAPLGPASVIGREFGRVALEHLHGEGDLTEVLESLRSRQLIGEASGTDGLAEHRFRNLVLRDVVYDGLLKRRRSVLHRRFGDWLLAHAAAGRAMELEEIVGYHLERAYLLGGEVAAIDDELVEVGRRAASHLGAAGERAFARGDMPAAANLLGRAAHSLHAGGSRAAGLRLLAGDARFETGAFDESLDAYAAAERLAEAADDPATAAQARLARATQRYLTGDGLDDVGARAAIDEAQAVFEPLGHDAGVARCWRLRAYVELTHCQWGAAEAAAEATIAAARRGGDHVLERRVQPALAAFSLHGPTPVSHGLARCRELLVEVEGDRRARALIERSQAHLLALHGDLAAARTLCAATRTSLAELGWTFDAALVSIDLGPIELMAGRPEAAERELRSDADALRALGEQNYLSTTTYLLAEAVRRQGRLDEALVLAAEAAAIAADDDLFSQAGWRTVRLRTLVERHELDEARVLAEDALAIVRTTDGLAARGDAHLDLGRVLAHQGDVPAAVAAGEAALAAYVAKEHRVGAAEAGRFLSGLRSGATAGR